MSDKHIELYQHSTFSWWVSYVENDRSHDVARHSTSLHRIRGL
jgi:hypothetical protein